MANNGDSRLCIFEPNVRFPEKPRPKKQEGRKTWVGAISKDFLLSHDSVAHIEYTYKTVVALGRRVFAIFGPVIASNDRVALPFDRSDYVVLGKLCKQRIEERDRLSFPVTGQFRSHQFSYIAPSKSLGESLSCATSSLHSAPLMNWHFGCTLRLTKESNTYSSKFTLKLLDIHGTCSCPWNGNLQLFKLCCLLCWANLESLGPR